MISCAAKTKEVDLHLAVISAVRAERNIHRPLILEEIAEICGISKQAVDCIERKAIRKLQRACVNHGITKEDIFTFARSRQGASSAGC